ncbi:MAG: hypothetical protein J1D85_08595, partial [Bacteroidales bacterium]|nr:hypothetical protein [Bacteroidales bacterium]
MPFFCSRRKKGNSKIIRRTPTMASKKNVSEYHIQIIREKLRQSSAQQAALLSRSVGRLTSCDALPCLEYRD